MPNDKDLLPFAHYQTTLGDLPDLPDGIHRYIKFLFTGDNGVVGFVEDGGQGRVFDLVDVMLNGESHKIWRIQTL